MQKLCNIFIIEDTGAQNNKAVFDNVRMIVKKFCSKCLDNIGFCVMNAG